MLISHQCKYDITFRNHGMLHSHLSAIRYERRDGPFAADRGTLLVFQVKIRGVESPYVLVRFVPLGCDVSISCDPISYERVARSDKITYVRI